MQENDKIYLVRLETPDWMFGRCKRGCEGLFPVNYVDIKVPLKTAITTTKKNNNNNYNNNINQQGPNYISANAVPLKAIVPVVVPEQRRCRALYDFNAEAAEDLSIRVSHGN